MSASALVYLFRRTSENDAFEQAFRQAGWRVRSIEVLAFELEAPDTVCRMLRDAESCAALALTSPRAAEALSAAFERDPSLLEVWRSKTIYAVGSRTVEPIQAFGLQVRGAASGTALNLAEAIIADAPSRPILFLRGNLSRETLPDRLEAAGIGVIDAEVYRTTPRSDLDLSGLPAPDWVAFFSPSGVRTVETVWPEAWGATRLAAIGPTTADAMESLGWTASAVAVQPTPDALLSAMERVTTKTGRSHL